MSNSSWTSRTPLAAGLVGAMACGRAGAVPSAELASPEAQQSYSLGVTLGQQAREGLGELENSAFLAGMSDALDGRKTALTPEQIDQALKDFDQGEARR